MIFRNASFIHLDNLTITPIRLMIACLIVLVSNVFSSPVVAEPSVDLTKLIGTYSNEDKRLVTVRKLIFTKTKNGDVMICGVLSGFPDDVDLGEATCESFSERDRTDWQLLLSFSTERFKPFMVVTMPSARPPSQLDVVCYMKGPGQKNEYFTARLIRDPNNSSK